VRRRHKSARRGAAAVEFGLVLPVLCLFLFGIIDYGWAFLQATQIRNAAREGARALAVTPNANGPEAACAQAANNYLTAVNVTGAAVACTPMGARPGGNGQCTVTLPFQPLVGFAAIGLPPQLTGRVTMRLE
jgi:Flp pilus assembly protein TadG